jgi:hypothetical protein
MDLSPLEQHQKFEKIKKWKRIGVLDSDFSLGAFLKLVNFFLKIGSKKLSPFNRKSLLGC